MPALGSCSTITSSASPQVLPARASRLDRPTVHAGYWSVIARVSDTTSKITSTHVAIANGDWTIPASRAPRRVLGGPLSGATKWNHADSSSTSTVSPSSMVVKAKCHAGNEFDHGTPKFDTYHQPLTLANDSATKNSTTAANTVRLRRERMAADVTATAASAPSDPASPANTPKWCVHLVGVNIIARNEMIVMPTMRRLGPAAVPGIRPLRNDIATVIAEREHQRQHREAAGHRSVGAGHEQPLVADVFVEPAQAGPDGALEHAGLDLAGQGLVAEDQDRGDGGRGQDGRHQRQHAEPFGAAVQDGPQRPDRDQQRADRRDTGRPGEQRQCADDAGDRHRQQPTGGHRAFHRAPGQQDAQRDDRLGPQAVVERQPEGQEHARRRPRRGPAAS